MARLLDEGLASFGIDVPDVGRRQLLDYLRLLDHWNKSINLTGLRDPSTRLRRLVLEPIWAARKLRPQGHYLDIGSGSGSPAIPWAVTAGFSSVVLVESRGRRATFLEVLARQLGLDGVSVHAMRFNALRAESLRPDWVTLQGVRLDRVLLGQIRRLNRDARVVWFTRNAALPEPPTMRLKIPESDREAIVFSRDGRTPSGTG